MAGVIGLLASSALVETGVFSIVSETAVAAGAGETVAGLIAGGAVGKAGQVIESKVLETGQALGEAIAGKEEFNAIEKKVNDYIGDIRAAYRGDTDYFVKKAQGKTFNYNTDEIKDREDLTYSDDIMNVPDPLSGDIPINISVPDVSPGELAKFTMEYTNNLTKQAFDGVSLDPLKALGETLSGTVNNKIAEVVIPFIISKGFDKEEYARVSAVYNGLNLSVADSIQEQFDESLNLKYFILTDEKRVDSKLYQTTGPIVPAMYDTFMGPRSQNDKLPTTLVGLFCAFHDYDYTNVSQGGDTGGGFANRYGDMKLLSRMSQNYERMTDAEKPFARFAMVYFSTLGNLVSKMIPQTASDSDGIYEAITDVNSNDVEKELFYDSFTENLDKLTITTGILSTASGMGSTVSLLNDFGNIIVELN